MSTETLPKLTIDRYETLFLGGLKPNLTKQDLFTHFSNYGDLIDISIKIDPHTGCNKGFAFILYKDPSVIQTVLATPQILDGRSVECKISFGGRHNQRDRFEASKCKLFVSNLHHSVINQDLSEHFKKYGPLRHAYVIYHPKTGVSRGFGYIHYQQKESVDKALENEGRSPLSNFKCERYSMHVKRDQEKNRRKSNSEEGDFTSTSGKQFENRAGCNVIPTEISHAPEKIGSPSLQNNQEAMDYNNQDPKPAHLDHTGQFALPPQRQIRAPENSAPLQNNYRPNSAKPTPTQPPYHPHPHAQTPQPKIQCNAQAFYPTYYYPQPQPNYPQPHYQAPHYPQPQHYVLISESAQQTTQFLYFDGQIPGGSGINIPPSNYPDHYNANFLSTESTKYTANGGCYGEDVGAWYYDPSLAHGGLAHGGWVGERNFGDEKNYHKGFEEGGDAFNLSSFNPRVAGEYQRQNSGEF